MRFRQEEGKGCGGGGGQIYELDERRATLVGCRTWGHYGDYHRKEGWEGETDLQFDPISLGSVGL